jgi:glycosyltransferase involved in cell wall biosynthesis
MAQIDIILPTYNQVNFLDRAIISILGQEFKDFCFIIVNDGSTDGTGLALRQKYSNIDNRITIIHNVGNKGLPATLNIGHAIGKSPYCTWVSTDNVSYKNQFKVLYECVIKTNCDFVQSSWRGMHEGRPEIHNSFTGGNFGSFGNLGPSFLYRREVWETYHYDENSMTVEDLKFYVQAILHPFKFERIDECLLDYYYQPNSLSAKGNPKRRYKDMMDEIYRTVVIPHQEKIKNQ